MPRKAIYLASPLGFAASTRPFMASLVPALEAHVDVYNPWDKHEFDDAFATLANEDSFCARKSGLAEVNRQIGHMNASDIDRASGLFAILDGVDVDSGTSAEIGYAYARGKYICGIRTDFRLSADNYGSIVNLQVEYFIRASGGTIVETVEDLVALAAAYSNRDS